MTRLRRTATAAVVLALGAVATGVLGFAAPASAHVSVNPSEATQGGYARLAFRVPTESDTASTTKVEVNLPADAPIASVTTMPVPGWSVAVEKRKVDPPLEVHGSQVTEAVSKITWTTTDPDAAIKPGEFQEFPVSMGPLPKADKIVFKTLQTYSDGSVVRWIEEPTGGEESAQPAPVLKLAPAANTTATSDSSSPAPVAKADTDGGDSSVALGLGIAGLVAGLAGLLLGGLAFARTRSGAAKPPVA
ncbi:YcnI family protein [Micromonospora sonneratiae]|uniref:YcnI family protein n=1 Tax=Micromonospora sonneratiae TaxID=1184706 RepID=A0ABW3YA48_9ACTN